MIKKTFLLLLLSIGLLNCGGVKQTYEVLTEKEIEKRLLGVWSIIEVGNLHKQHGLAKPGIFRINRNKEYTFWMQYKTGKFMRRGKYEIIVPPQSNSQATLVLDATSQLDLVTGLWGSVKKIFPEQHPTKSHGPIVFLENNTAIMSIHNYRLPVVEAENREIFLKWEKIAELPPTPEEIAAEKERLAKLQAEERKKQEEEIAKKKEQEKENLAKLLEKVPRVVRPGFSDF